MKERIERLRQLSLASDARSQGEFFNELVDLISDLAHKVEEFEPEEITMDEMNTVWSEYNNARVQVIRDNGRRVERDKLARELVGAIFSLGSTTPTVLSLATQLKEKLDDK